MPNLSSTAQPQAQQPPEHLSAHFGGPALLFGAYLFFFSWLLLFYYFRTFGVSLVALDIPVYFYLTFAWTAVDYFGYGLLGILTAGAICYVLLNGAWGWDGSPFGQFVHKAAFAAFLMFGLWGTSFLAQQQGQLLAQQVRDGGMLPSIRLFFEKDQSALFPEILKQAEQRTDNSVKEPVLLFESKTAYYVLVQKVLRDQRTQVTQYDSMGMVYRVPKKYVGYAEVDVVNTERMEGIIATPQAWTLLFN